MFGAIIAAIILLEESERDEDGNSPFDVDVADVLPDISSTTFVIIISTILIGAFFLFKWMIGWEIAAAIGGGLSLLVGYASWDFFVEVYREIKWKKIPTLLGWMVFILLLVLLI